MSGASPDGLVDATGLVEIKCPNTANHIEYLLSREPPQKWLYQMQWQMACTERDWCDWVSFDSRMPESLQLVIVRIPRDDEVIGMLEEEIQAFLTELDTKVKALEELKNG